MGVLNFLWQAILLRVSVPPAQRVVKNQSTEWPYPLKMAKNRFKQHMHPARYQRRWTFRVFLLLLTCLQLSTLPSAAISITGYSSIKNDRFISGFPLNPIFNGDNSFVGAGLDWSGVGWSTTTYESSSYKGLAMLSPRHFLTAQHYEYTPSDGDGDLNQRTQGIRIKGIDGLTWTASGVDSIDNLGYGLELLAVTNGVTNYDLAIGKLAVSVTEPSNLTRTAVLDLHSSSTATTYSAYNNLPLLMCGRSSSTNGSPRVGTDTPNTVAAFNSDSKQTAIRTTRDQVQLQLGDSGHPLLHAWTNPNGDQELTVLGMNSAIDTTNGYNYSSFLAIPGAIQAAQTSMDTIGFALRLEGNPLHTWIGGSITSIGDDAAWGYSGKPVPVSDDYVLFDASSASSLSVSVNSNHNIRGLYFKESGTASDSFTFSGGSILTIGRGGLTNYDDDPQVISAIVALGSSQYWAIGTGGIQLANLDTNGYLLELDGNASSSISGNISDSGSIALSSGQLTLNGNSTYTGNTWIHGGELIVNGDISGSAELIVDVYGTLSGSGSVPVISGSGLVAPGNSPGILTTSAISPTEGLDFAFEFTAASTPDFGSPTNSINDLIRMTGATPLTAPLDSSNTISIYLNVTSVEDAQQYRGGFFTDTDADFLASISQAKFVYYIADPSGSVSYNGQTYSAYSGIYLFSLMTQTQSADFGSGTVNGRILQIATEPDQRQYAGWKVYYDLSGADAENTADTDFDGMGQLLEFAFGGDPNVNDLSILPTHELVEDGGSSYLELTVTRPIGLQGIIYTPQTTSKMTSWPADSTGIVDVSPTPQDNSDGTETLVYRRIKAVSNVNQAFIRVDISETP